MEMLNSYVEYSVTLAFLILIGISAVMVSGIFVIKNLYFKCFRDALENFVLLVVISLVACGLWVLYIGLNRIFY